MTDDMNNGRNSLFRIFRVPLILFVVSVAGLVTALLVEGHGDLVAALCVAAPVATTAFVLLSRRR